MASSAEEAADGIAIPTGANDSITKVDVHVGMIMRALRKARGVSQDTLAAALGVSFQQIQKYELGRNRISASKLFAAAMHLDVSPGAFFEGLPGASSGLLPPAMVTFLAEDGAMEVAEGYGRLSASQRRAVVAVITGMLE